MKEFRIRNGGGIIYISKEATNVRTRDQPSSMIKSKNNKRGLFSKKDE